jgi:hypothetical protein
MGRIGRIKKESGTMNRKTVVLGFIVHQFLILSILSILSIPVKISGE